MNIRDIIAKHYNNLYNTFVNDNKVISQSYTPEDILNSVILTAIRKYDDKDIPEEEGLSYLKKTLYTEHKFKYARKKNEIIIFTDSIPDVGESD